MKTYNLGAGTFLQKVADEDCYCVLGILMKERGKTDREILRQGWTIIRDELAGDADAMAAHLSARGVEPYGDYTRGYVQVYDANDSTGPDGEGERYPAELFQEALSVIGIKVNLVDKRSATIREGEMVLDAA